mmetsp:Transcript_109732/g.310430  ORF Transcript_109732/g.310430 Transcript_109732/m.310430 type:complete len:595 (-) Transcript_109732:377-2161(-)
MEFSATVDRAEFDRFLGQEVLKEQGLRPWILQCRLTKEQKDIAAAEIVRSFWECPGGPPADIENIFGVEVHEGMVLPDQLSSWPVGSLVGGCWSQLSKFAPNASEENVLQALLQGNLTDAFRGWVLELSKTFGPSDRSTYVGELAHRNAWERIPWDHAMLHAFCPDYPKRSAAEPISQQQGSKRFRAVWIKLPPRCGGPQSERQDIQYLKDAVRAGLLEERFATWDALWKVIRKGQWVEHSCGMLRYLGEDVALFAEPAANYLPDMDIKNLTATLLACDKNCVSTLAIPGKALLVRKDSTDFRASTAERLCNFFDGLRALQQAGGTLEPERTCGLPLSEQYKVVGRAMEMARSNWPKYCIEDTLLPDGTLRVANPETAPLVEPLPDQAEPPVCAHGVPDIRMRGPPPARSDDSSAAAVELCVLQLSRSPAVLHEHIATSSHLDGCRQALQQAGLDYRLPCGAYVFVDPKVCPFILEHLEAQAFSLRHSDITASLCYEDAVMRTIYSLPRKYKLCIRHRELLEVPTVPQSATTDNEPNENDIHVVIKCTFIHVPIPSSLLTEPSDGPRTASTTDAQPGSGQNPRRAVARRGEKIS